MAFADTAKLVVDLSLAGNFSKQLTGAKKALGNFDKAVDRSSTRAFKAGQQIGTGIKNGLKIAAVGVGLVFGAVALGLNSLVDLEKQQAQTAAVIKSTGKAAGITADEIRNLSEKYEGLNATIDDKVIQSGANVLLTFTNIRKKAFEPALAAALNLSTAMGQPLQSSIVQIGKALNDPVKGIGALRRVGVQLSDQQEKQIVDSFKLTKEEAKRFAVLQKSDKKAAARFLAQKRTNAIEKAQLVILAELNKEFGGSFLAEGGTTGGKVAKFNDSIEDLQKTLATALLPTVGIIADRLTEFLADPAVIKGAQELGKGIAGFFTKGNIDKAAGVLTGLFTTAQKLAPVIVDAATAIGGLISTAVTEFQKLPPEIQNLAIAGLAVNTLTGGLVTNIAGGLISAVIASFKGLIHITAGVVTVTGAVGGAGVPGGKAPTAGAGKAGTLLPLLGLAGVGFLAAGDTVPPGDKPAIPQDLARQEELLLRAIAADVNRTPQELETLRLRLQAVRQSIIDGASKTTGAIKAQDLDVTVNTNVKSFITVNGRQFASAIERATSMFGGKISGLPT